MVGQIYPAEIQFIKQLPLILKPRFWTYISSFLMLLFLPNIYDKRDDFDFEIVNFPFNMVMFLALHLMEYIFLNSSELLEPCS